MKNKNHTPCDYHPRKRATKNVQTDWIVYSIDDKGEYNNDTYSSDCDPIESYHLCDKCYDKWEEGNLGLS